MPYPELFDRSGRTFAATFAKFGDLSYFTPVQRIGCFMDFNARLKKKHILDLIAHLKSAQKGQKKLSQEEESEDEVIEESEYFDHSLFIGLMPDETGFNKPLFPTENELKNYPSFYDPPTPSPKESF